MDNPRKVRATRRKRIVERLLRETYSGRAVLLEELRWLAYLQEKSHASNSDAIMNRSYRNSFNRTINGCATEWARVKLNIADGISVGTLTKAAMYRIDEWGTIERLLESNATCVYCTVSQHSVDYPYVPHWVRHLPAPDSLRISVGCAFFESDPGRMDLATPDAQVLIPITHILTAVAKNTPIDVDTLAGVPWSIYSLKGKEHLTAKKVEVNPLETLDTYR